jgi:Hemerythrin HHE cation binding domain
MGYVIDVHRLVSGDMIDLILADHQVFKDLLRALRNETSDRPTIRDAIASVLVAHAEAEEKIVYPSLRHHSAVNSDEAEHGEEEHVEGHEALLKVLVLKGTDTKAFSDAVEELSGAISHHLVEEELTILNPARNEVGARVRADMGAAFAKERNRLIDEHCGELTNVRRLVARAQREGKLDDEERGSFLAGSLRSIAVLAFASLEAIRSGQTDYSTRCNDPNLVLGCWGCSPGGGWVGSAGLGVL